ncbi:MAG: hypothetical protein RTV31_04070 [Candidatus Thorarchaeota archaeon]
MAASLLPIIILPIIFIVLALRLPILILDIAPWPYGQPGGILARDTFYLLLPASYPPSELSIPLLYSALWILIGVVLLQMFYPSSVRRD